MNHWPFILGSYAAVFAGTIALVWISYAGMRKAEREADALRRDQ
jgi:hypothetical protein